MSASAHWSVEDAERYLLGLELFGMRFGLDRMRRLMTTLDQPERRYDTIHVVGTNGKSSTTRMIAAILQRHGLRAGAYLSPHLVSFTERVRVDDHDAEPAAFSELAAREVDVAVIEAGLGGRWDATNVLPSKVQVLTTVGLEHTRWLGPTVRDIAREKLAVVREGATLVIGADLHPDAQEEAHAVAERQGAKLVTAPADPGIELAAPGGFQRRNFALARAAAEAYRGSLELERVRAAAAAVTVPGRLQVVAHEPLTLLDGAHNAEGVAALAESLPQLTAGRRLVAVVSVLDDKDAAGMLRALLPHAEHVVFTRSRNPRALPPATLASLCAQLEGPSCELEADPRRALARAREVAGAGGVVLATGSIYLVADLLRPAGQRSASML
ncbi:MAG TPA: cyanophycin synthetase [Conexibacter sp.]|nr:cyanophycin synthetase [Conexibacter sp.]